MQKLNLKTEIKIVFLLIQLKSTSGPVYESTVWKIICKPYAFLNYRTSYMLFAKNNFEVLNKVITI